MISMNARWVKAYILPATAFQAVILGAGYGTGREVAQYLSQHGPVGGLLSAAVIALIFGGVLALSFELARIKSCYDYRSFFRMLLGRFWGAYEVLYITALIVTLAVIGAAAGVVLNDSLGVSPTIGVIATLGVTILANIAGRGVVNRLLTSWSIVFFVALLLYLSVTFFQAFSAIKETFVTHAAVKDGLWFVSGAQFALFNLAVAPALLFTVRGVESRKEAITSGFFAGFFGIFPAIAFHVTFMADYPATIHQELPVYYAIRTLGVPVLMGLYGVALCGTIVQTGVGMLQGLNERIDSWYREARGKAMPKLARGAVVVAALASSAAMAKIGIVTLVAKGYSYLAVGFLIVYILPLVIRGSWIVRTARKSEQKLYPTI